MKFLLSTPWTVVRFIKLESPTVRERYAPNWGTLQQPIQTEHRQAGVLSGALLQVMLTNHSKLFFLSLSLHSPVLTYLDADRVFWLNVRTAVLPQCCSHTLPSPGYFGTVEKLWLTPGRNPLATAIYREGTQSHLHLELMRDRKTEREWERSMKDTVRFWNK